jgi:hypothetical protein
LIWAALSPLEVMGWWAGWYGETIYDGGVPASTKTVPIPPDPEAYLFFVSGIGKATGETLSYREKVFLNRLAAQRPRLVIIDNLFLYSVNNLPLTGQPFFARLWRWALQRKLHGPRLAGYLINVRNIWQLMISADRRYGPMYNQALAQVMVDALLRHQYDPNHPKPIFLVGYSGAGQMAVGPVVYLKEWLDATVVTISLGGVFASDPGIAASDHFYHLHGRKDRVHQWGMIAPGRWRTSVGSDWNRARRLGKVTLVDMGPMDHTGRAGYLDHKVTLPDGTPYVDKTVAVISEIVERYLSPAEAPAAAQNAAPTPVDTATRLTPLA